MDNLFTWLKDYWRELGVCVGALGTLTALEIYVFPDEFSEGIDLSFMEFDLHVNPIMLKLSSFLTCAGLFYGLVWYRRNKAEKE